MKMRFVFLILTILSFGCLNAQISRAELEKKTSKGISLIADGNLEDAIAIFNDILSKDPTEGKALLLRARTKYELSAFKGAKKDCFAYMDIYGIDAPVAGLLGKTEKAMENYKQALAYLKTALMFDPEGEEYLLDRADIFYNLGLDDQACEDWYTASIAGSSDALKNMKAHCKSFQSKRNKKEKPKTQVEEDYTSNTSQGNDTKDEEPSSETEMEDDEEPILVDSDVDEEEESSPVDENTEDNSSTENNTNNEEEPGEEEPEEAYPIDNSIEEIFIDEELTIVLADGIGSRKLVEKPDILILSDKSGEVVVNVCIDRLGRVQNPTLNSEYSTITAPSLISLALRESSNFRFERSSRKSHCGTITYQIKGSE